MTFEDFNYAMSNKYVLIDPNYDEEQYMSDQDCSEAFSDGPLKVKRSRAKGSAYRGNELEE